MLTFGDKIYRRIANAQDNLFDQGEIAQLTFQAFNRYVYLIQQTKEDKIKVTYPVGYGADNKPINNTDEYTKADLIEKYKLMSREQLPINGIYQLVTTIEALLSDILRDILIEFPAKIPNKRKLDYELVLEAKSLEEIKIALVNSILNELSYKSPRDFADEFHKYAGVNLLEKPAFHKYIELKATRDIYIHNQGIANEIYLTKANSMARVKSGEELPVNIQYFLQSYECCLQVTEILEEALNKTWPSAEYEKQKLKHQKINQKKQAKEVTKLPDKVNDTKKK